MYEVIMGSSALALAFGMYCLGVRRGREEGEGSRRTLEHEIRSLRIGGSTHDPFRVRSEPRQRRVYPAYRIP